MPGPAQAWHFLLARVRVATRDVRTFMCYSHLVQTVERACICPPPASLSLRGASQGA
jgi:hypothetical protein